MRSFYDGGQGDNRYQLAIVGQVQAGNLLGDYFYRGVRAHYPPLYFWIAGGAGRLLGMDAQTTVRWAPIVALLISAAGLAWIARQIGAHPSYTLIIVFALGSFAAYYLFSYPPDRGLWMVLAAKPQQLLGGVACLALPVASTRLLQRRGAAIASIALLASALVLTMPIYAPIGFLAAIGTAVFLKSSEKRAVSAATVAAGLGLGVLISSFYLVPVVKGLLRTNSSSGYIYWQSLASLDISHWTVGFGFGIPITLAAFSVKRLLNRSYDDPPRTLIVLLLTTFLAWLVFLSAYLTYPLFGWSLFTWWVTVPSLLGTCLLASWQVGLCIDHYMSKPRQGHHYKTEALVRTGTAAVVAIFSLSWFAATDDLLAYAHSPIDPDFAAAAKVLELSTSKKSSFVGGQEELIVSALSGRGLVFVAHSFYASPLVDSDVRREDVLNLLHRPSCQKVFELKEKYGMEAIALNPATRWIKLLETVSSVSVEDGTPPLVDNDLVFSELVAVKRGDPKRVSKTVIHRASPELAMLPCLKQRFKSPALIVFLVEDLPQIQPS